MREKTVTESLPQHSGELSPAEADRMVELSTRHPNLAANEQIKAEAMKFARAAVSEYTERARNLFVRWRTTYYMLSGNTLDRAGPVDVHVPELYKAYETIVSRLEEIILERDPWFSVRPRSAADRPRADALSAFLDWQFDQAKVRDLTQPLARDMIVTQVGVFFADWENRVRRRFVNEVVQEWNEDKKDYDRSVVTTEKEVVEYYGPRVDLVDPFNFIVDTKCTDVQKAAYVGHRSYVSIEDYWRLAKSRGWANAKEALHKRGAGPGAGEFETQHYSWPRSPTARSGQESVDQDMEKGRPRKVQLLTLYGRFRAESGDLNDYRIILVEGQHVVEVRKNPSFAGDRPYAVARCTNNGHEFFGVGPFDNAVRLNQHLDRHHSILMRAAEVGACPLVFAEDGSDLPDSLYKIRPFSVIKGAGQVNFTSIPNASLQSAPLVIGMLQRNIEETVGAFRIQMGQADVPGNTATEATLALQEGNRRIRALVRSMSTCYSQLLTIFHHMNQQFSLDDVEFPVMGRRGVVLKQSHLTVGPEDFLPEVDFTFYGLKSLHTYGLKATGYQAIMTGMQNVIAQNPHLIDQVKMFRNYSEEVIGVDATDEIVKVPTDPADLLPQTIENEILITGTKVRVDEQDDDIQHLQDIKPLWDAAKDPDSKMGRRAREAVIEHAMLHVTQSERKEAQEQAKRKAQEERLGAQGLEAGGIGPDGQRTSPPAGGVEAPASGGSQGGMNNGPPDAAKYGKPGRSTPIMGSQNNIE